MHITSRNSNIYFFVCCVWLFLGFAKKGPCETMVNGCCPDTQWDTVMNMCVECSPGFFAENCSRQCLYPYYGKKCNGICSCENTTCNFMDSCDKGMSCAEYKFGGKRIQKGEYGTCKAYPTTYLSTESYKYQECYVMKSKKTPESKGTTESAIITLTTPEHNISSLATPLSQELNYTHTYSENTPSPLIISSSCVAVGVPILAIVALVVNKSRKNLPCSRTCRPTIEKNRARSEKDPTSETMDSFEEEKEQLTPHISNNQGLCYESDEAKDRETF